MTPPSRLRVWLRASRPLAQLNLALPLVFGQVLAWVVVGSFSLEMLVWIHLFGLLDQLYIVYANDWADAETDSRNTTWQAFSGGSRVIPEGHVTEAAMRNAALVMLAATLGLCAWLAVFRDRPLMLPLGIASALVMQAYSFRPLRLSYTGYGEAAQGIGLGACLPLIGYYLQAGELGTFPWGVLLPLFLVSYAANIASALSDHPSDQETGKRTCAVRNGPLPARRQAVILVGLGLATALLVGPTLPWLVRIAMILPSIAVLGWAIQILPVAEAVDRAACRSFVLRICSAINLLYCFWPPALAVFARTS